MQATVKEELRELLERLPDDVTYEDLQYHLYVRQKVAQGLDDVRQGRVLTQDEVEARLRRWLPE